MKISQATREHVRERAKCACEYCGVKETDIGSLLTIDHFIPLIIGGTNHLDNLVYCCHRCNEYKHAYFPTNIGMVPLWNPRENDYKQHFLEEDNGILTGLTQRGQFTVNLLRLNRPPLVTYRLNEIRKAENEVLLKRVLELTFLLKKASEQASELTAQQRKLLDEQLAILKYMTNQK